ncbi:MAG: hypothetical protein IKJ01_02815 [Lachnospiraceae bacterium]|nr:hypothetical protein [Lachnospiraceae bacterium]
MTEECRAIKEKILRNYKAYITEDYCNSMCELLEELLKSDSYRKPLIEWKNGKREITDVTLLKFSKEEGVWSLNEIASRLDPIHPNIPAAAILLFLAEENILTLSQILSIAEEVCWADPTFLEIENPICTYAFLDEEVEEWVFLMEETEAENLKEYQMWQVLLQVPTLAPLIAYDHILGTHIELGEDDIYYVVPPQDIAE